MNTFSSPFSLSHSRSVHSLKRVTEKIWHRWEIMPPTPPTLHMCVRVWCAHCVCVWVCVCVKKGIARSILRLSSSKNEEGHVCLCLNLVTFMIPARVAPVGRILATTVALGSFSSALILLSPSMIIFSSDFAAEHRVSLVKATCFQPK